MKKIIVRIMILLLVFACFCMPVSASGENDIWETAVRDGEAAHSYLCNNYPGFEYSDYDIIRVFSWGIFTKSLASQGNDGDISSAVNECLNRGLDGSRYIAVPKNESEKCAYFDFRIGKDDKVSGYSSRELNYTPTYITDLKSAAVRSSYENIGDIEAVFISGGPSNIVADYEGIQVFYIRKDGEPIVAVYRDYNDSAPCILEYSVYEGLANERSAYVEERNEAVSRGEPNVAVLTTAFTLKEYIELIKDGTIESKYASLVAVEQSTRGDGESADDDSESTAESSQPIGKTVAIVSAIVLAAAAVILIIIKKKR
ncbi:MAG: hypothetical protein IJY88_04395 [Clostridia bacterium]|nr:hypothetical protein [Clostridia bacterium]